MLFKKLQRWKNHTLATLTRFKAASLPNNTPWRQQPENCPWKNIWPQQQQVKNHQTFYSDLCASLVGTFFMKSPVLKMLPIPRVSICLMCNLQLYKLCVHCNLFFKEIICTLLLPILLSLQILGTQAAVAQAPGSHPLQLAYSPFCRYLCILRKVYIITYPP